MDIIINRNIKKYTKTYFIYVFVFLAFAFSYPYQVDASTLTDVNPSDKSLEYLRYIFGSIVDIIVGGTGPSNPDAMLGALSEVLNTGMLFFTGLIAGYVFLTGLLNSAHEGNPLGKVYNTMWVPLRMTMAVALVLPFAGGYSTMQIGVLWLAGHGIGMANSTWNASLDFMANNGSLYPPVITMDYEAIARNNLQSRVCMHGINTADRHTNIIDDPIERASNNLNTNLATANQAESALPPSNYTVQQRFDSNYSTIQAGVQWGIEMLSGFSNGVPHNYGANPCGSISLTFPVTDDGISISNAINTFQSDVINATANLDSSLDPLARAIVAYSVDPTLPTPDINAFNSSVNSFKNRYIAAVNTAMSSIATQRLNKWAGGDPEVAGMNNSARTAGWLSAGAWYWDFQRINAETQDLINVAPTMTGPTDEVLKNEDYQKIQEAFITYTKNMNVTDNYGATVTSLERSSYSDENWSANFILDGTKNFMDYALKNPDPVSGMSNLGHAMIILVEAGWLASRPVDYVTGTAKDVAETTGGFTGAAGVAITAPIRAIFRDSVNMFLMGAIMLIPLALMLAFYLPATPLILWVMGIAGWFVLLIEAVIAAPIWAASHAMPEGDGLVGQRAMAGYMVMLSLFLRPTLMLFGFFAGMVLMIVMGKVVSLLFIPYMSSMTADKLSGIATMFGMMAIFTALIIQIAHRAYGLIHEVPDKVLRYIGGGAESLGEANNEQQGRSFFIAGAAKVVTPQKGGRSPSGGNDANGKSGGSGNNAPGNNSPSKIDKQLTTG